jgi:hypothetical protein
MSRSRWIFAMTAALLVGVSCSDDPVGGVTQAGTVTLRLTTPHADDGAVLFEVTGPAIDGATVDNASLRLFTRRVSETTITGALVGAVTNGVVITLRVPEAGPGTDYTARVLEVADRENGLRGSLTGYALTAGPP